MSPSEPGPSHYRGFTITLRHITPGSTPLDEWSTVHRDLYMTTYNNHKRQTSMLPAGFEPDVPANEWTQTHAPPRGRCDWFTQTRVSAGVLFSCHVYSPISANALLQRAMFSFRWQFFTNRTESSTNKDIHYRRFVITFPVRLICWL
jgi:hypothetical protein